MTILRAIIVFKKIFEMVEGDEGYIHISVLRIFRQVNKWFLDIDMKADVLGTITESQANMYLYIKKTGSNENDIAIDPHVFLPYSLFKPKYLKGSQILRVQLTNDMIKFHTREVIYKEYSMEKLRETYEDSDPASSLPKKDKEAVYVIIQDRLREYYKTCSLEKLWKVLNIHEEAKEGSLYGTVEIIKEVIAQKKNPVKAI